MSFPERLATRMRTVLGFEPMYSTRAAFLDFAPHVTAVVPGAATAVDAVQGAAGSAANALVQALSGRGG